MTDKQKRFADEYIIDCNATRAYKKAYPNIKSDEVARKAGSRLLTYVDVKSYIDRQLEELHSKKVATAQEVLEYLTSVVRGESKSMEIVVEGCGEGCSTAREFYKEPSEKDRLKAAELLGKRYGIYTDKVQTEVIVPVFAGEDDLEE